MTRLRQCEKWVGETKKDWCKKAVVKEIQRYVRRKCTDVDDVEWIQFGWKCDNCGSFQLEYQFEIV